MMDNINEAVNLAMQAYKDEYGEDAEIENGDEFITVFNDGALIISMEDSHLEIKFILGKPYVVDFKLGLSEEWQVQDSDDR